MEQEKLLELLMEQQLSTIQRATQTAHSGLNPEPHVDILYQGVKIGDLDFLPLLRSCLQDTEIRVSALKCFNRPLKAYTVARYFQHVIDTVPGGPGGECGVFSGFVSLMLCRIAEASNPQFKGENFHLIDSFEGLSPAKQEDAVARLNDATGKIIGVFSGGNFSMSLENVRRNVGTHFPDAQFHKGWIPPILQQLPEQPWAFMHIDVDLYEPTKACLEYFYPRMLPGGIIVTDDYITPQYPGCRKAWSEFCAERELGFLVFDSGQALLVKP